MTDFIHNSAGQPPSRPCSINELFMVSSSQYSALMDMLDQPSKDNAGLRDLFARRAPWDAA